jgi:hypothetical protein
MPHGRGTRTAGGRNPGDRISLAVALISFETGDRQAVPHATSVIAVVPLRVGSSPPIAPVPGRQIAARRTTAAARDRAAAAELLTV